MKSKLRTPSIFSCNFDFGVFLAGVRKQMGQYYGRGERERAKMGPVEARCATPPTDDGRDVHQTPRRRETLADANSAGVMRGRKRRSQALVSTARLYSDAPQRSSSFYANAQVLFRVRTEAKFNFTETLRPRERESGVKILFLCRSQWLSIRRVRVRPKQRHGGTNA